MGIIWSLTNNFNILKNIFAYVRINERYEVFYDEKTNWRFGYGN